MSRGVAWDVGRGDGREDPARVFRSGEGDQGDRPRAEGLPQGRQEGHSVRRDVVPLSPQPPARSQDGTLAGGARFPPPDQCREAVPRAADAGADIRGAARARLRGWLRHGAPLRPVLAAGALGGDGGRLCSALLRARRGLSVRLEPRDRPDQRRGQQGEGRPRPALPFPHAVRAGIPRESQEMVFDAHDRAFAFFKGACQLASTTT